jgi:sugar O-acyltransferase (sialic acid O-acetyltransferase NeuD family)
MTNKIIIIGAGEMAEIAYEYFTHDSEYEVAAFAVEKKYLKDDTTLYDLPVVAFEDIESLYPNDKFGAYVAISSGRLNRNREDLYLKTKSKGYKLVSYVSSKAFVWHNAKIGENTFIFENNVIQHHCQIGNNVIMWSGNHIGHRSIIKDHCFITSHVVVSGFCEVGEYSFMGVNSCVADEKIIAKDNFIAMGAAITKNTEEDRMYKGTPAKASDISCKKLLKV